jgi:hypothetical protein
MKISRRVSLGLWNDEQVTGKRWRGDPLQHFVPGLEKEHPKRVADGVPVFPTGTEACPGLLVQAVDEFEDLYC